MAAPNAAKIQDAIDAFWAWLTGKTTYTDLGLIEFRGYDGRVLPVREDGTIEGPNMPAIYVEAIRPAQIESELTPETEEVGIEMEGGVVYANTAYHEAHSSVLCAAALMTLSDVILNRDALDTNLGTGAGGAIDSYEWEVTGMDPVRSAANPMEVLYWDGTWRCVLTFVRSLPASTS